MRWPWTRRRTGPSPRVQEVAQRVERSYREEVDRAKHTARLADSIVRRGERNEFGESMIRLFRGA